MDCWKQNRLIGWTILKNQRLNPMMTLVLHESVPHENNIPCHLHQ